MASLRLVPGLCFAVFSLIGLSLQQNSDLMLEVEPRYINVGDGTPVTLTCTLNDGAGWRVPLAGCGFKDLESGAAWDIGTGSATINNRVRGTETNALITSNTEANGVCSLKITGLPTHWIPYLLGCRVRPVEGAWRYGTMIILVNGIPPMQYHLQTPGVMVSLPGSDVIVTGEAEQQLLWCSLSLPPTGTWISLLTGTSQDTTGYRAWTEGSRCGVTLRSVQPSSSGFMGILVWSNLPIRDSVDFVELVVATPPVSPPLLSVNNIDASFQAGDMLHATCVVGESRPVSNITWLFSGEVIREDNWNEAPAEPTWRWNYEPKNIIQRLSRRLTKQDNGKELKCRAEHFALPTRTIDSNTRIIHVGGLDDKDAAPISSSACGNRNKVATRITGGSDAIPREFPWHAAIFEARPDRSHKALCSGTLIKQNVVVTAAHCVYLEGRTTLRNSYSVKVVLGKLLREWDDDLDDSDVQRFNVDTMHVVDDYVGLHHDFLHDIALIKLLTNASLGGGVNVACVDWENTFGRVQLQTGSIGTVAGWGLNIDIVSSTLQSIDLPWVETKTCRNHTKPMMRRFLTRDKFCAGFINRSRSVCPGNSGGGLVFLNATNNRYYLRGVVSTTLAFNADTTQCYAEHYSAFISVGDYIDWIKRTIERFTLN